MENRVERRRGIKIILGFVAVVMFLGGAGYFWQAKKMLTRARAGNEYQAVFLDNGQIYFGKVSDKESTYVTLTDIYYLQFQQSLQNQDQEADPNQSDLTLIKLGNELHGPKDEMEILRDHILFIETLADDSRVVKAILDHENTDL